jgi:hypothetical protein
VSELQQQGRTEGLSQTDARRLEIATETRDRTAKALQDDPLDHTVGALADTAKIPPPAPLNVGNQPTSGRPAGARAVGGHRHPDLRDRADAGADHREATQVRAALDAADPAGKARIYSDIVAATSGGTRAATLAKLGAKGVDGMVEAYAGAMTGLDPAIGESIIRGQAAMKAKDAYNPRSPRSDVATRHRQIPARPARSRWRPAPIRRAPMPHARRGDGARGGPCRDRSQLQGRSSPTR